MEYLLLFIGTLANASAVIFIKAGSAHPFVVAYARLILAIPFLLPFFIRDLRKAGIRFFAAHSVKTLLPGVALGIHFLFWIAGARLTGTANSTLIVNMMPVVMPFLLVVFVKEIINKWEIIGTFLSMAGLVLLTRSDFHISTFTLKGDIFCLISMLFLAFYLVLAKVNRKGMPFWLYIVPVYAVAGIFCLIVTFFFTQPFPVLPSKDFACILGLALVPTVMGHSISNFLMRRLRGQIVSLAALSQFIFAGLMGYIFLFEKPMPAFYPASLLVIAGAVLSIIFSRQNKFGDKPISD